MGFWGNSFKPVEYEVDGGAYQLQNAAANRAMLQNQMQNQVGMAPSAKAAQMQGVQLGQAQQAAISAGPSQLQVDPTNQAGQQAILQTLQARAMGQGPSVAEQQLRMGQQQSLQAQMAAAASMRGGGNPALAQRQLMSQAADQNQQTNAQAAMMRAQEMTQAGQLAAGAYGQARDQDVGMAQANANLGMQNTQMQNQGAQFNASAQNQFGLQQGQMSLQTSQQNAANQQAIALANQAAMLQQRQLNNQAQQYGSSQILGMDQTQLQAAMARDQAQQQAFQNQQQLRAGVESQNGGLGRQLLGGALSGAASLGSAALMSDERLKEDIDRDAVRTDVRALLDAVDTASYRYKDAKHGEGRKWGVMAQSLQKSNAGRSLVVETPEGLGIDTRTGFGTLLAAMKDLHDRTKQLEGRR